MKRDYVYTPVYEMVFEMTDGDNFYLFGNFEPRVEGKITMVGDCIPLYSKWECDRLGMNYDDVPWIDMPYGDYTCDYDGGLVSIKKGDEIIFMFYRNQLKRCITILPPKDIDIREKRA